MSVSRDFIDSYSPEAPSLLDRAPIGRGGSLLSRTLPAYAQCGGTKLVFGFHIAQDFLKPLISLPKAARLVLALGEERLERLVQTDGLVDLGARARPIGAEPDQLLHVGVGRHHLPGKVDDR